MKYINQTIIVAALLAFTACDTDDQPRTQSHGLTLTSSVANFVGESDTRVNVAGTQFVTNDLIRIKVVCPYVSSSEIGETTHNNSYDAMWLQRWSGTGWTNVDASFNFDVDGDYKPSPAPSLLNCYLSQQTPYVFTASTWSVEHSYILSDTHVLQYASVFSADQTDERDYRNSDVLWAQTIMQTGTDYVHLDFHHVMAALYITVDGETLSENAVLTIEGMPDIDKAEVLVGDKYATLSKTNSSYGYRQKNSCSDAMNGKVLGICVNDEANQRAYALSFDRIEQTATYRAFRPSTAENVFRLIVPPCRLTNKAVIWVRDGVKRWSAELSQQEFEEEQMYNITLNKPTE